MPTCAAESLHSPEHTFPTQPCASLTEPADMIQGLSGCTAHLGGEAGGFWSPEGVVFEGPVLQAPQVAVAFWQVVHWPGPLHKVSGVK